MKASLRSKMLILSLASLAVIGTGCERQGRAPQKATQSVNTDKSKAPVATNTAGTGTKSDPAAVVKKGPAAPVTSAALKAAIAAAKLVGDNCEISIDASEAPSKESYGKDYTALMGLYRCEKKNGVVLSKTDSKDASGQVTNREWSVNSSANQAAGASPSALLTEFLKLAKEKDANDDSARDVLVARITVFQGYVTMMNEKYGTEDKLPAATAFEFKAGNGKVVQGTVGPTQIDINKMSDTLENARADLAQMKSVADGASIVVQE